jgi:hypothetical protein
VTVSRPDLTLVAASADLDRPELRVPEAKLAGLPGGASLVWMVEAVLPDGARLRSPVSRVVLR